MSSEVEIKQGQLKGSIRLGRFEFPEPSVTYPALSQDGNIGSQALKDFTLTFDQKNHRVKLARHENVESNAESSASERGRHCSASAVCWSLWAANDFLRGWRAVHSARRRAKAKLKSVSDGEFTLEEAPSARIKFVKKDSALEIQILNPQGQWGDCQKGRRRVINSYSIFATPLPGFGNRAKIAGSLSRHNQSRIGGELLHPILRLEV